MYTSENSYEHSKDYLIFLVDLEYKKKTLLKITVITENIKVLFFEYTIEVVIR